MYQTKFNQLDYKIKILAIKHMHLHKFSEREIAITFHCHYLTVRKLLRQTRHIKTIKYLHILLKELLRKDINPNRVKTKYETILLNYLETEGKNETNG